MQGRPPLAVIWRWRGVLEGELFPHRKARCGCGSDGAEALRPIKTAWGGTDRTWDGTGGRRAPSQQVEVEVRIVEKGTGWRTACGN